MKRQEIKNDQGVSIVYERPTANTRLFSAVVDYVICLLLCLLFVFAANSIVKSTDFYKTTNGIIDEVKIQSCLFERDAKGDLSVITLTSLIEDDNTANIIKTKLKNALEGDPFEEDPVKRRGFLTFADDVEKKYGDDLKDFGKNLREDYDKWRIELVNPNNNKPMFEKYGENNSKIRENGNGAATIYIDYCYKPFIANYASKQIIAIPEYFNATHDLSTVMLAYEIPIPVVLSIVLTFYIPGLIFVNGRKSFGKLIFKCGIVNKDYYNPTFGQYTLRSFLILLETALFVPCVLSFTFMTFGKKQQTIHDYLLKMNVVNTKGTKIYKNKLDAYLDSQKVENKAVEFSTR